MTVRLTRFGGSNWADDEVLYAADLNDTITKSANESWYPFTNMLTAPSLGNGVIVFSGGTLSTESAYSLGSGNNWTARLGYGQTHAVTKYLTSGCAVPMLTAGAKTVTTIDAGSTWLSGTAVPNIARAYAISQVGSVVIINGRDTNGPKSGTWFSWDGGSSWTQTTSSTGAGGDPMGGAVLFSSTTGFLEAVGSIWRTTDGGSTWTARLKSIYDAGTPTNLISTASGTVYSIKYQTPSVAIYDDGVPYMSGLCVVTPSVGASDNACTNLVIGQSGNIYFVYGERSDDAAGASSNLNLFKINGSNVYTKPIGFIGGNAVLNGTAAAAGVFVGSQSIRMPALDYHMGWLYLNMGGTIRKINVLND